MTDQIEPSNTKRLISALGRYPSHVTPIPGFNSTVFEVCGLLSHRTREEVRFMLTLLNREMTKLAEYEDLDRFDLPPPGFNWPLHGTGIWRGVQAIDERYLKALSINRWEFVAAVAWRSLAQAISVIGSEPLGLLPTQPSARSLSAMKAVDFWFRAALLEKRSKVIKTGEKIYSGSRKGNQSPHKSEESRRRKEEIRKEAELLRSKNHHLSEFGIAKIISEKYQQETGYSVRTIQSVLKTDRKK